MNGPGRMQTPIAGDAPMAVLKLAIRAELKADGATQADLARYLGLSEKHVSQVLTGKIIGSWPVVEKMAAAVGLSLSPQREPGGP